MKKLLCAFLKAITIIIGVMIVGMSPSLILSAILSVFVNDVSFADCICCPLFWIVAGIGWILTAIYVSDKSNT